MDTFLLFEYNFINGLTSGRLRVRVLVFSGEFKSTSRCSSGFYKGDRELGS